MRDIENFKLIQYLISNPNWLYKIMKIWNVPLNSSSVFIRESEKYIPAHRSNIDEGVVANQNLFLLHN